MKNTHIILVALLLFNCTDNIIGPVTPDRDAASKTKSDQLLTWTGYTRSLIDANIFLTYYKNGDGMFPGDTRVASRYIITDGTSYLNTTSTLGSFKEDYAGATYVIIIILSSSDQGEDIGPGDYVNYESEWYTETPVGSEQYVWNTPTKVGFITVMDGDFLTQDSFNPTYLRTAETYFTGLPIKICGKTTDKGKMTIEFAGPLIIYPSINNDNLYPGSLSFTGKVQDVTSVQPPQPVNSALVEKAKIKMKELIRHQ